MKFEVLAKKYLDFYVPNYQILLDGIDILKTYPIGITSVTVEDVLEGADRFSLSVSDPGAMWLDSDLFEPGKSVVIRMGYVNNLTTMIQGEISSIRSSFPADGTPQLEISGYDLSHQFVRGHGQNSFEGVRDSDIVAEIAGRANHRLETQIDETEVIHPHVTHNGRTDYDFIRELADRNSFEFFVREETLHFQRTRRGGSEIVTLKYGASLLNFTSELNTANQPTGVRVGGWNIQTKEPIVGQAMRGSEEARERGRRSGGDMVEDQYGAAEEHITDSPVSSQQEADTRASSELNRQSEWLISGTAECIGLPEIRAGENIRLEGLGRKFSRRYYIESARHTIGSSGYSTSFSVKENTI